VHVRLTRAGAPLAADFVLALDDAGRGAGGLPGVACEPSPGTQRPGPRCTLAPSEPITAVATHGTDILLLATAGGVSAWRMPEMTFARGFAPPPPGPGDVAPHADVVTAIAPAPDGGETAVAIENRILVYETATGLLRRELPSRAGDVRALAWSPDGTLLLATVVERGGTVWLLRAADGRPVARVPLEHAGAALAFAGDGLAAVGGVDAIALVRPGDVPRVVSGPIGPVDALAFAGDRLLSAGGDGVVRAWDVATERLVARWPAAGAILALAPAPDGRRIASARRDGTIRVHEPDGTVLETLAWHDAPVVSLAWSGATLVSGDATGRIAVWDIPPP
jgi:WD40 repeat protein